MFMPNGPAAAVGLDRSARAGVTAPMMADASGAGAIAQAWQQIVFGDADIVICGAVESPIEAVPITAYAQNAGVMATDNDDPAALPPFDRDRTGMVFGEGGALVIMETEVHAKARGARIQARVLGAATTSDGYDAMFSDPDAEQESYALAARWSVRVWRPLTSTSSTPTLRAPSRAISSRRPHWGRSSVPTVPRFTPQRPRWATPSEPLAPSRRC